MARIVSSVTSISYFFPVRLSTMLSVSGMKELLETVCASYFPPHHARPPDSGPKPYSNRSLATALR